MLSFLHNPVVAKPNYRLFVIHKFPSLRVLDFKRVKDKEREEAKALFKSKVGKDQMREIKKRAKTFTPGAPLTEGGRPATNASGLTPEQVRNIKASIARATTLEEIERLNQMLRTGQIPGEAQNGRNGEYVIVIPIQSTLHIVNTICSSILFILWRGSLYIETISMNLH